jgi:NADH dehydrogenase/NADH:ubiquinone oxidoreductase subunit G
LVALGDDQVEDDLVANLSQAGFVTVLASYASPLTEKADVVLPVQNWAEQEGHYLSLTGKLQKTATALKAADGVWSSEAALAGIAKHCGLVLQGSWEAALKATA